jgi:hypothetical protein
VETPAPAARGSGGGGWQRLIRRPGGPRWYSYTGLCFAALALFFSVRYVIQEPAPISTASPYAHGDGVYYYVYLRSLMFDGDVDFTNDLSVVGNPFHLGVSRLGKPRNFWTGGTALFWSPFAFIAQAHLTVSHWLGWNEEPRNGAGPKFQRITLFGSVFWGLIALGLIGWLVRPMFGERSAVYAMLAVAFASPLHWYMLRQPSFSHASSAAAVALFVAYWYRSQDQRSLRGWVGLGLLLGLAMLVRPQNALHALLPLSEWLPMFMAAARSKNLRRVLSALAHGFAFALPASGLYFLQMLAWKGIYGKWMLDAHEASFLDFTSSRFLETLFASRMGLFAWHPLLYVAFFGLVGTALYPGLPRKVRRFASWAVAVFLLQAVVNGAAVDWWAGWSFGGRRFMDCSIYFGVGLAAALHALVHLATRASAWITKAALPMLVIALPSVMSAQLAEDYMLRRIPPGQPQVMEAVWTGATSRIISKIYQVTGNWGSIPLNWWLAGAAGVSPARYDMLSSNEVLYDRSSAVVPLLDTRFALEGFAAPETIDGRPGGRMDGDKAILGFALRKAEALDAHFDVYASTAGVKLQVSAQGRVFHEHVFDKPGWQTAAFEMPKWVLRSGINLIHLQSSALSQGQSHGPANVQTHGLAFSALTLTRKAP